MSETLAQIVHGLHRGLPADQYHADDALNNSRLTWLAKSPMYCKWREANPIEPTPEMALGSLLHTSLLEPRSIKGLYAELPKCDRRTTAGKSLYLAAIEAAAGKTLVNGEDMEKAQAMVESVLHHPYARAILASRIDTELSGFWTDEETGLRCKFRADAISKPKGAEFPTLVDIKTTRSIEPSEFRKSMRYFGYYRQIGFYLAGLAECDLFCEDASIIAVENVEPYEVAVFPVTSEDWTLGQRHARALMRRYAQCIAADHWPDANNGKIAKVRLSDWDRKEIEADISALEGRQ